MPGPLGAVEHAVRVELKGIAQRVNIAEETGRSFGENAPHQCFSSLCATCAGQWNRVFRKTVTSGCGGQTASIGVVHFRQRIRGGTVGEGESIRLNGLPF